MRLGSLCTGYGGLDLAVGQAYDVRHAWHAENDPDASRVLAAHWPDVTNLGDLTAVDWSRVEPVDILTAGYPCQPLSTAGKRRGTDDERWIWPDVANAIRALRPRLVVLENVPGHLSLGFGRVLGDLAEAGFDAEWGCVRASDIGTPHRRERVFIVAWPADAPRVGHGDAGTPSVTRMAAAAVAGGAAADGMTLLPTPNASRVAHRLDTQLSGDGRERPNKLGWAVSTLLPTPTARDGTSGPGHAASAEGSPDLRTTVMLLPTPASRDWRSGESNIMDRNARPLNEVIVNLLPTPTAARYGNNQSPSPGAAVRPSLDSLAHADRWGDYAPAIARWEHLIGRPAPDPTEPGTKGQPRLSPRFVEWLMGVPAGWVTDHLPRNAALRVLGNGVVPQQAAYALSHLAAEVSA